jgi:phosphoglycerate dehydrogenase-like enzyme
MKILVTPTSFTADTRNKARKILDEFADEVVFNPRGKPLEPEEVIPLLDGIDGYIAGLDHIDERVIKAAPSSLKIISRYGAGFDRVDLEAAAGKGIAVTNTPGANADAVADLTMGLMLAVAREIPLLDREVKSGGWLRRTGCEIFNKTLGIIGLGLIGKKVALRAKGFSMNILVHDPYADPDWIHQQGMTAVPLDDLLAESDVITFHVPLTDETRKIVNPSSINRMKPGVLLINTSRYELCHEETLLSGLSDGTISGLGLDVYAQEPPTGHPLLQYSNAVLTPHAGSHSREAKNHMAEMAVANLVDVLLGKACPHIVNFDQLKIIHGQ